MTLMPTSQMEVRGQGTTNTILLQDARKPDWCAQNGNPACTASAFPLKAFITPKPEGSFSRQKTIVQTLDKEPCGKKKVEEVQLYKGGTKSALQL